ELIQIISLMRQLERIAVQMREILRDHFAFEVVPRTFADAVERVDCMLAAPRLRAEIGVPGVMPRAGSGRKRLAVRVSASKSAEIAAVADGLASHEKIHHRRWLRAQRILTGPWDLRQ